MATLIFNDVKPTSSSLETWQSENGAFKSVPKFGLSQINEFTSAKNNKYLQCERKAFVQPGQFARLLTENPNAKFGKYYEVVENVKKGNKTEQVKTGRFNLEIEPDAEGKWLFNLDKDGKLHLLS